MSTDQNKKKLVQAKGISSQLSIPQLTVVPASSVIRAHLDQVLHPCPLIGLHTSSIDCWHPSIQQAYIPTRGTLVEYILDPLPTNPEPNRGNFLASQNKRKKIESLETQASVFELSLSFS